MKNTFLSLILLLNSFQLMSQTWFSEGGIIPDDGTSVAFPINITTLNPSSIDTIHGVSGVKINLIHTYDSDLHLALIAPDGTTVILSSGNGWDGDNYENTHFSDTASISILEATPPYTGYFRPQEMMGTLNNGRQGNGTWLLYILDTYPFADQGQLLDWSITFSDNPTGPFLFSSSNLPIVMIETFGQQIPDDPKILTGMKIIDNGPGQRNNVTDIPAYDGYAGIELRGSSSQMFPKKSYGFETWNSLGEEIDVPLLGMPEESDWILNANYSDKTLCRNTLAYQVFSNMGHYATRYKHVEVVINGIYKGIYIFSEKIKRDADRVNIARLQPDQNSGDPLTGGYIFKIDKPTGSGGGEGWESDFPPPVNPSVPIYFQYEYPKADDISESQKSYISDYVHTFESVLNGPDFDDPENGFRRYADEMSFLDYFLVNEISKNVDGFRLSTFIHKQRESLGGKLRMGPVWDYDIAWHNANYYDAEYYTGWSYQFNQPDDPWQVPFWWSRLLEDTVYTNNLKCRWTMLRGDILSEDWFDTYIDSLAMVLEESQQRNFTIWPIMGVYIWPNPWPYPQSYAEEIAVLKDWIHNRLAWLDENIPGTCYTVETDQLRTSQPRITMFPNPAGENIRVNINVEKPAQLIMTITNPLGKEIIKEVIYTDTEGKAVWYPKIRDLIPGVWFITVDDGIGRQSEKFVKM